MSRGTYPVDPGILSTYPVDPGPLGPGSTGYESLWDPGQLDMHAGKPRTLPLDPGFMAALPLDPGAVQPHVHLTRVLT
jgi:hypothetical protein